MSLCVRLLLNGLFKHHEKNKYLEIHANLSFSLTFTHIVMLIIILNANYLHFR